MQQSSEQPRQNQSGTLYVVATPIGNLEDITHRALRVLSEVSLVLAEDTRHSKRLLNHYGISTKLKSCHEHNEQQLVEWVAVQLNSGLDLALISDAGTPLISDPGFVLVRALRLQGYQINVVPGACSAIAALSIAGLPTDRFVFDGFLAAKRSARQSQLNRYLEQVRTIVLLESSHRIVACLEDIVTVLGSQRALVIGRELTKKFETILTGTAQQVLQKIQADNDQTRGEFVVMIAGAEPKQQDQGQAIATLKILMAELPLKQAATLTAKLFDGRKNELYDLALKLRSEANES